MKKLLFMLTIATAVLASCGGEGGGAEVKLDTKDVKGTINADGVSTSMTELHTGEAVYEVPNVKFNDDCRMQIVPTEMSFDEELTKKKNSIENFGGEMTEIEKKENAIIWSEKSEFAGKKSEGFNFLVWVKGKDKNYMISGEGNTPFEPIAKKEDAEKAFTAAQTFKPAE